MITFRTKLLQSGKTATGIVVPAEIVAELGTSKKPAVKVTVNGYSYRSTIAVLHGQFMLPFSSEHREATGIRANDEMEITLELDEEPRVVNVPDDLITALNDEPEAKAFFEKLSYSNKLRHVLTIQDAKTPETRQRRINKSVAMFRENRS